MTTTFYRHWRDEPALDRLQALRDRLGKPLIVRSAYRQVTCRQFLLLCACCEV